jgi:translocation and assembly module TamB
MTAMTDNDDAPDPSRRATRLRRILRRVSVVSVVGLGLAVVVVAALVGVLQLEGPATWVAHKAAGAASTESLEIDVGRVSLRGLTRIRASAVEATMSREGTPTLTVAVDSVSIRYRLLPLLGKHVAVSEARVIGVSAWAAAPAEDPAERDEPASSSAWTFGVDRFELDVREVALALADSDEPWRLTGGRLRARDMAMGPELRAVVDTLHARFRPPERPEEWGQLALSGHLDSGRVSIAGLELRSPESDVRAEGVVPMSFTGIAPDGLELDVDLAPFHLADVGPFLPAGVADSVRVRGKVSARTEADTLRLTAALEASVPGRVEAEGSAWGPRESPDVNLTLRVTDFDLLPWGLFDRTLVADADADVRVRDLALRSVHGGVRAEARLRDPAGPLDVEADLQANADGVGDPWQGQWGFAGLGVTAEGDLGLRPAEVPEWSLRGRTTYAANSPQAVTRPAGADAPSGGGTASAGDAAAGSAFAVAGGAGRFEASGSGFTPNSMDARVTVELERVDLLTGAPSARTEVRFGPGRVDADLRSGLATVRATLDALGGRMELGLEGDLAERTGRLTQGTVRDFDVAALFGDSVSSTLSADLSAELTALAPLDASGRVRVLEARYGPRTLDSATVVVRARDDVVEGELNAAVPDSGRIAVRARALLDDGSPRSVEIDSVGWRHLDARILAAASDSASIPRTALSGSGNGRLALGDDGWAGDILLTLAPSAVGDALLESARFAVRLDGTAAAVDVAMDTDAGRVRGQVETSGEADQRSFEITGFTFDELNLGALSGGLTPETGLSGHLEGTVTGTVVETAEGMVSLDLGPSTLDSLAVDTLSIRLDLDSGTARARAFAELFATVVTLDGEARLTADEPTYAVQGQASRPPRDDLDGPSVFARFGAEGTGVDPDSARATIWMDIDSALVAGEPLEVGRLRAALDRGAVRLDTLELRGGGIELRGGGSLPATLRGAEVGSSADAGEIRVAAFVTRPDLLSALRGEDAGVLAMGAASFQAVARGALDDLGVEATGRISALLVDDIRVQGLELDAEGRLTAEDGWASGEARLTVDRLRLPTAPVQSIDVEARLEPDDELSVTASAVIDGRREVELHALVEQRSAPSAVRLERLDFRADQDRWVLAHPTRVNLHEGFAVDSLLLAAGDQTIRLQGAVPTQGALDLRGAVTDFEVSTLADLLGFPNLRGRVSGSLDLSGTATEPVFTSLLESRLTPTGVTPSTVRVAVDYRERVLDLEGRMELESGSSLRADLELPFHLSLSEEAEGFLDTGSMSGNVVADAFPLGWFEPFVPAGAARDLEGVLDGQVGVAGTPEAPELSGRLALDGASVTLPDLGVRYRDAEARVAFDGSRIDLESMRVRSGRGSASATGVITLDPLAEPGYDIEVRTDGFEAIGSSAVQATVSGDVRVQGVAMAPRVSGVVEVERADLYLGDMVGGSSVDPVTLTDEQWEELARVFGYQRPSERGAASPFMDVVELDLDVRLGRASWVRQRANPELALQFNGDMSVTKEPGDSLQLLGSVEAVPERSWVEQFGRRFSIEEGQLTFQGTPGATRVQVRAAYAVPSRDNPGEPEVVLTLQVQGTPDALELELSSTPPLEASDMVSYLVTGRPASQSLEGGGEGSLTEAGGALALGRLSGAVETYAREQVGLDVVEITNDGTDGVTLLAGRYLSPRFYLGVRQPISLQRSSDDPSQSADPEIEAELQAVRWLLLNLRAGGRTGVEFYVRSRIAYD